jgi:uncharacterized membrane protein
MKELTDKEKEKILLDFRRHFMEAQKPLEPEFRAIADKQFWELL